MFSVVIPFYNSCSTINRSVESVFSQTLPATELILVDDGSTDGGGLDLPGVRLLRQSNQGVSAARNAGIRAAKQPYVAFLDADDIWDTTHLETLRDLIADYPNCHWYSSSFRNVYADGRVEVLVELPPRGPLDYMLWIGQARGLPIHSSGLVVRRDLFDEIGMFKVGCRYGEDEELWVRAQLHGPLGFTAVPTLSYYLDTPGNTASVRGNGHTYSGCLVDPATDLLLAALREGRVPSRLKRSACAFADLRLLPKARACLEQADPAGARVYLFLSSGSVQRKRLWAYQLLGFLPPQFLRGLLRVKKRLQSRV
jgi:hypothetical protein